LRPFTGLYDVVSEPAEVQEETLQKLSIVHAAVRNRLHKDRHLTSRQGDERRTFCHPGWPARGWWPCADTGCLTAVRCWPVKVLPV
jgi:hypothetical protein